MIVKDRCAVYRLFAMGNQEMRAILPSTTEGFDQADAGPDPQIDSLGERQFIGKELRFRVRDEEVIGKALRVLDPRDAKITLGSADGGPQRPYLV